MGSRQESIITRRARGPRTASKTHLKALDALFPSVESASGEFTATESYDPRKFVAQINILFIYKVFIDIMKTIY